MPPIKLDKDVYTTGEAAKLCRLSQQTVIRCIDAGTLKGYRVPGSSHRRVTRGELARFIEASGLPTDVDATTPTTASGTKS